jgi:hypothetical protein
MFLLGQLKTWTSAHPQDIAWYLECGP